MPADSQGRGKSDRTGRAAPTGAASPGGRRWGRGLLVQLQRWLVAASAHRPPTAATEPSVTSQGFNAQTQRALTSILASGMGADQIPGMAVGIWAPGQGQYVAALGLSDHTAITPLSLSDHFRIASISKSFIAHTVLRLFDQRRLALSDKLESFVPGIPNGKKITIEQLLGMTSGIYDYVNDPDLTVRETANPLLPFSLADVVKIINQHEPLFEPGADAVYDNSNYYLLGAIIEKVTGNPLHRVVKSQVLDPLGLNQTSYPTTPALPTPFSRGYFYQPNLGCAT